MGYLKGAFMNIKANNCREMTEKTIEEINAGIELAKEKDFSLGQVKALNLGNIVMILGAIAHSLAVIADTLDERRGK